MHNHHSKVLMADTIYIKNAWLGEITAAFATIFQTLINNNTQNLALQMTVLYSISES